MTGLAMVGALTAFAGCGMHASITRRLVRYTRNGGIRFLRIGRLQVSVCICKRSI